MIVPNFNGFRFAFSVFKLEFYKVMDQLNENVEVVYQAMSHGWTINQANSCCNNVYKMTVKFYFLKKVK